MRSSQERILYVDEDEERGLVFASRLRLAGYEVVTAEFASAALQLARTEPFDLFLLSRRFPTESGAYLCHKLYEIAPQTPIIFFASLGGESREVVRTQAREYTLKTGGLGVLVGTVAQVLSERAQPPALTI